MAGKREATKPRVTTRKRATPLRQAVEICIDGERAGDAVQATDGSIYWYVRSDKFGVRLRNTAAAGIEYKSLSAAVTAATDYVKSELRRT